jgi:hypothetical protein
MPEPGPGPEAVSAVDGSRADSSPDVAGTALPSADVADGTAAPTADVADGTAGSTTHGHSRPDACSVLSEQAGISAFGSASEARFWLAVEQSGPWGRDALSQSHLDASLGTALSRACQDAGGRLLLIRRPGQHADAHHPTSRRVLVAGGLSGPAWLLAGDVPDAAQLLGLPFDALASGDPVPALATLPALARSDEPALLVCTNARRDVCCAVRGRPVALEAAAARPGQVWECSHTGGHRFAPTAVLLPHGQTWARLTSGLAVDALDAAAGGRVPASLLGPMHDRGRSVLSPPAQAAESFVRHRIGEVDLTALCATAAPAGTEPDRWFCTVTHRDGRSWKVLATRASGHGERPDSCGKTPVPTLQWDCTPA